MSGNEESKRSDSEKAETRWVKIQEAKQDRCENCGKLLFRGEQHVCKS